MTAGTRYARTRRSSCASDAGRACSSGSRASDAGWRTRSTPSQPRWSMNLIDPRVAEHLDALVPERHKRLRAMEEEAARTGFPIIGPAAGHFCYLVARLIGARSVFELGSGFGYSTAWFARAVQENGGGSVHHVVWDEALSTQAREHLDKLGYRDVVQYHVGEAVAALSGTRGCVGLAFHDSDKAGWPPPRAPALAASSTSCSTTSTRRAIPRRSTSSSRSCAPAACSSWTTFCGTAASSMSRTKRPQRPGSGS